MLQRVQGKLILCGDLLSAVLSGHQIWPRLWGANDLLCYHFYLRAVVHHMHVGTGSLSGGCSKCSSQMHQHVFRSLGVYLLLVVHFKQTNSLFQMIASPHWLLHSALVRRRWNTFPLSADARQNSESCTCFSFVFGAFAPLLHAIGRSLLSE